MINRKKLLFISIAIFCFVNRCDCIDPCGLAPNRIDVLILTALLAPPPFSGSCLIEGDCIDFRKAENETLHANLCEFREGEYRRKTKCDITGKSASCSSVKGNSALKLEYYYGSTWSLTDSADHCVNSLDGEYTEL